MEISNNKQFLMYCNVEVKMPGIFTRAFPEYRVSVYDCVLYDRSYKKQFGQETLLKFCSVGTAFLDLQFAANY